MSAQEFTPTQRSRIKAAARAVLTERDEGRECDPHAIEWAEYILRMNPSDAEVPFDGDPLPGDAS